MDVSAQATRGLRISIDGCWSIRRIRGQDIVAALLSLTREVAMSNHQVQVLSIHDKRGPVFAFDLKDILEALEAGMSQWQWCVTWLDSQGGPQSEALCQAVDKAKPHGQWLSSEELTSIAKDIRQTIEGLFIAFPKGFGDIRPEELDRSAFPSSRAELLVEAVDSSFFEVYAKEAIIADLLGRRFKDIRQEDPTHYFEQAV